MTKPRLHLDANASLKSLQGALITRGYDVTRMPTPWLPADASPELQLLGATAHNRVLLTFSPADFTALAERHPQHAGILLAAPASWTVPEMVIALDRVLSTTQGKDWQGKVRWLDAWRTGAARVGVLTEDTQRALLLHAQREIEARTAERQIRREPVESSSLASVSYDPNTRSLEIEFRQGSVYRYYNVPFAVYTNLMTADSIGRYFVQAIRDHYRFARVT